MKRIVVFSSFVFLCFLLCSEEGLYKRCLDYRVGQDSDYKTLKLQLEIAEREEQKLKVASVANIELGLSDLVFSISKDKERTGYTMSPYLNFSLPIYNNTGFRLSSPNSKTGDNASVAFNFVVFTELYGVSRRSQKLILSNIQEKKMLIIRECKRAERNVEAKLLKEIKELSMSYLDFLDKQLKVVKEEIAYNQLKVQGYGEGSVRMKTARLSLLSVQRDEKEAKFLFELKYERFLSNCGLENSSSKETYDGNDKENIRSEVEEKEKSRDMEDFLARLFESTPKNTLIALDSFSEDTYISIIDAKKEYNRNMRKRDMDNNLLSLQGEAGFSHSKKTFSAYSVPGSKDMSEQSLGASLALRLPGTKITAGLDFPLDATKRGDVQFKFGFAINPIEIWNYTLAKKNVVIENEIENLKLQDKIEAFDVFFSELKRRRDYLLWQQGVVSDEILIYKENMQEYERYFNRGLVGNYEKLQADLEYRKASIRSFNVGLDINSFNIETLNMFDINSLNGDANNE